MPVTRNTSGLSGAHPQRAPSAAQIIRLVLSAGAIAVHTAVVLMIIAEPVHVAAPESRASLLRRLFHDVNHSPGPGADFFALYHAGVNARHGLSVFAADEQPQLTPYYFQFRYLPATAQTLGRAAASLSPRTAWLLWVFITETFLIACVIVLRRMTARKNYQTFVTMLLLLSTPYWLELYMGQFTFVAMALTVLAIANWNGRTRHLVVQAGLMTVASLLKVYPVVALPAFLRSRRGWWLVAAVIAVLIVSNAPLFMSDFLSVDGFWLKNFVGEASGLDAGNHGLLYAVFVACQVPRDPAALAEWGKLALMWRLLLLAGTAAVVLTAARINTVAAAATLLIAHFLSYFQVWEHHFSAAILAGLLLLLTAGEGHVLVSRAIQAGLVMLALPSPYALQHWAAPDVSNLALLAAPLSKGLPLLCLYCAGMYVLVIEGKGPVAAEGPA